MRCPRLSASVSALAQRPLLAVDAATTPETIVALAALESKVAALKLTVLAHAEQVQVGTDTGCTSPPRCPSGGTGYAPPSPPGR